MTPLGGLTAKKSLWKRLSRSFPMTLYKAHFQAVTLTGWTYSSVLVC